MHMQMGDALANTIIHGHKRAFGFKR